MGIFSSSSDAEISAQKLEEELEEVIDQAKEGLQGDISESRENDVREEIAKHLERIAQEFVDRRF